MVLITGVIKNTDGTPYVGSVKFALNDLGIESNTVYLPTMVTVESDGTFTVDLWPNTNSLTSSYYKCSLDNGSVFNISIPGNNPSYNLGDVILIDPGTLDPGIIQRLNLIESGITTRVGDLEDYTGIADNRIPSIAISGDYPNAVAGKVSKVLTIGDGLTGGTYRGDTDVAVAVDGTVIRATDDRLSDAREWVAPTAPIEVVSQPTNTTRYAWTPQRIWDTIVSWFSNITSDDIQEGSGNLYYTDNRVTNNTAVQANTNKVSAAGSVTTHSDVTSAGSGQIITTPERTKLAGLNSADYLPVGGTAVNSQLLNNIDSSQFLRSDTNDTFYGSLSQANNDIPALVCQNSSYPGNELHIGGWSISNTNSISRIRNSNQNLHIDCAANGNLYLNWYTDGNIFTSSPLRFYNKTRTLQLGDIGSDPDDNWFRINQITNKNIYTPRMFRADGGIQVDAKQVVSADGNTLYENNVSLATKYIRKDIEDTINVHTQWADNKELRFGSQADGCLFHSGADIHLHNYTGDNFYQNHQQEGAHIFQSEGSNIIRFSTTEVRHYVPLVNGSSRHIKDIKGDLLDGLDLVNRLNPVVYNYKGQKNTEIGLIAEEVPPESHLVYGSGPDMAIDYTKLPIYMIDAIQQLTKRIETLEENAKNSNGYR